MTSKQIWKFLIATYFLSEVLLSTPHLDQCHCILVKRDKEEIFFRRTRSQVQDSFFFYQTWAVGS